jgi:hypothetical protein
MSIPKLCKTCMYLLHERYNKDNPYKTIDCKFGILDIIPYANFECPFYKAKEKENN